MSFKVLLAQSVSESGINLLRSAGCEVVLAPEENSELMIRYIADCDAVFSKTFFLTEEILSAGSKLKVVGKHGVGVDNVVSVDTATKLGLFVVRTPLANMDSVAEHTMAAILALAKNVVPMDQDTRAADFNAPERYESHDIGGSTLGIIGCGNIGRSLARKAYLGFDMKILAYDPYVSPGTLPEYIQLTVDLNEVFQRADYVSLHLAASEQNNNFVNAQRLGMMKKSAFLINFSRGSNVCEKDLYQALTSGAIRGAALDVYEHEPVEKDNPLLTLPNVVLSPHCAALTVEAMERMSYQGAQGILDVLNGRRPQWCMNYEQVMEMRG